MRYGTMLAAALLAFTCCASPASAQSAPAISASDQAAIDLAAARGKLIHAYDQAAWHGTDDLAIKLPDFGSRAGGWIVDGPAEAAELVFFDRNEAAPAAIYIAQFRNNRLVSSRVLGPGDDRTLSPARRALIAARKVGLEAWQKNADSFLCAEGSPNTVVLPPSAPGAPTLVYILTPQTELDAIPFGGHSRVEVGADGKAGNVRGFTRSCIAMKTRDADGSRPVALTLTHLLDPVPTEIHVFSSYAAGLPIFVMAGPQHLFEVDRDRIRLTK